MDLADLVEWSRIPPSHIYITEHDVKKMRKEASGVIDDASSPPGSKKMKIEPVKDTNGM